MGQSLPLNSRIVSADMPDPESHREEKQPVNYGDLFMHLTGRDFREKFDSGESSVFAIQPTSFNALINKLVY